jgi:hypothetical protein
MMANRLPTFRAEARSVSMAFLWLGKSPWEKFRRATFMPARIIFSMISWESDAGPMVQTIFVLFIGRLIIPPALRMGLFFCGTGRPERKRRLLHYCHQPFDFHSNCMRKPLCQDGFIWLSFWSLPTTIPLEIPICLENRSISSANNRRAFTNAP